MINLISFIYYLIFNSYSPITRNRILRFSVNAYFNFILILSLLFKFLLEKLTFPWTIGHLSEGENDGIKPFPSSASHRGQLSLLLISIVTYKNVLRFFKPMSLRHKSVGFYVANFTFFPRHR